MKKVLLLLFKQAFFFAFFLMSVGWVSVVNGQKVEKLKYHQIEARLARPAGDTLTVVNYWATWCRPCVKELPYFDQLHQTYSNQKKIRIWLVSLDFPEDYDKKLVPFVKNKKLACPVIFLDESNPNDWVGKVEDSWSGAIPATVLYDGSGKKLVFHAGEFDYEGLKKWVDPHLKP